MSHKKLPKRGRPRAFDAAAVLVVVRDAFWRRGLAGVSLDQVSAATGVARPSLAAAFGDKRSLYLRSIEDFVAEMDGAAKALLGGRLALRAELTAFFRAAVDLYLAGETPRGCMVMCTMPVEAVEDADLRESFAAVIARLDAIFTARFRLARAQGELGAFVNVSARGSIAASLLHSIALRARAGASRASLLALIREGISMLVDA